MGKKEVLYVRVSSLDQNSERQKLYLSNHDYLVEDFCSGSIPLFEREGGKKLLQMIEKGVLFNLCVWSIDRIGRDVRDILNTIHYFNEKGISVRFVQQGLETLGPDGKENDISKMVISILGVVAEMERKQIKERQKEGIAIAKLKGVYEGRKKGTKEGNRAFLEKHKKVVDLLEKGYKGSEISKITDLSKNTITKIKKVVADEKKE